MGLSFNSMKVALDVAVEAGHVPNIVGLQGIGKSDLVREYTREHGYGFAEITCSLIQEGDLAMPYISGDKEVLYAINKIITNLCEESKDKKYGILFLDEFNRSSSQVQSELMNLVLQREIVGYRLADNIRVVLAMNPSSDMEGYGDTEYSVSYSDSAMLGRVVSLDMVASLDDWLSYGNRVDERGRLKVHDIVQSFLTVNKDAFVSKERAGKVNNTPRGWSRVSDLLYSFEDLGVDDFQVLKNLIRGTLEDVTADSFVVFYKNSLKSLNYHKLAKQVLASHSTDEWPKVLFKFNDAELDKVFNFMLEIASSGKLTDMMVENLSTYILSVEKELTFSWVSLLDTKYSEIYDRLLENDDFSSYVLSMFVGIKSREVGGFSGK